VKDCDDAVFDDKKWVQVWRVVGAGKPCPFRGQVPDVGGTNEPLNKSKCDMEKKAS